LPIVEAQGELARRDVAHVRTRQIQQIAVVGTDRDQLRRSKHSPIFEVLEMEPTANRAAQAFLTAFQRGSRRLLAPIGHGPTLRFIDRLSVCLGESYVRGKSAFRGGSLIYS